MQLVPTHCSLCEKPIDCAQLAVLVAYVMVQDGRAFAVRTVDLFHKSCWNDIEDRKGAPNAPQAEGPHEHPPFTV